MERKEYIQLCQRASFKTGYAGAWWAAKWDDEELVYWKGEQFVPVDYQFGFRKGNPTHQAILHDLKANAVYIAPLSEIEQGRKGAG